MNAARDIFTRWYLEPFGSNAFDEQELSSLFSPMITVSPRTQWGTGPGGGMINLAEDVRKRRRTDNGAGSPTTEKTPSGLDSQSTIDTPGPTISTDALTVVDDDQISPRPCPSSELLNPLWLFNLVLTIEQRTLMRTSEIYRSSPHGNIQSSLLVQVYN